jgi:acetolactate synthase-1/2/3 large subunit
MQAFEVKKNSRLISAWNHSPMGYSLPASIGAAFAEPNRQVICISGDGGMQINIQELATIVKHNLNIKIFVVNNHCHGIIQGTQQSWLDSRFNASDPDYGKLPDPDFNKIAKAYGMDSVEVCNNKDVDKVLIKGLSKDGPLLINVHMKQESQIYPKLLFGKPIEDSHPLLERDDFYKQMIVKPIV